jgi:hypothetical protein
MGLNSATIVVLAVASVLITGVPPGNAAEAAICRSDLITYVSDDGKREFIVTETRRGTQTIRHAGGTLTKEMQVIKGLIGEKTFYVYDESTRSNTGRIGSGVRQQMLASDRLMDQPLYKLTQESWPVFFEEGRLAFHLFSGSMIPEEMAGLWLYSVCRSRPTSRVLSP